MYLKQYHAKMTNIRIVQFTKQTHNSDLITAMGKPVKWIKKEFKINMYGIIFSIIIFLCYLIEPIYPKDKLNSKDKYSNWIWILYRPMNIIILFKWIFPFIFPERDEVFQYLEQYWKYKRNCIYHWYLKNVFESNEPDLIN